MQTFQAYLLHVQTQGSLTYQEVLDTLSLAVLFQVDPKSTLPAAYIPQDALLQTLYSYQNGRTEDAPEDSKLLFPDTTSVFMETLQEKDLRKICGSIFSHSGTRTTKNPRGLIRTSGRMIRTAATGVLKELQWRLSGNLSATHFQTADSFQLICCDKINSSLSR